MRVRHTVLLPAPGERVRPELRQLLEAAQPWQLHAQVAIHAPQPRRHRSVRIALLVETGLAQQLVDRRPRLRPQRPEPRPGLEARRLERRQVIHPIWGHDGQIRPRELQGDARCQRLGRDPLVEQMLHEQHRCVDDPGAPEVVDDLLHEIAHVRHELAVERQAALECAVRQRALTEAVDRVNRREVEVRQRLLDPAGRCFAIVHCRGQLRRHLVGDGAPAQCGQRLEQHVADALAQLLGRRHRVGDDEGSAPPGCPAPSRGAGRCR